MSQFKVMKADELRRILERLGMNQSEFAMHIGVSHAAVSKWLSGKRNIKPPVAYAIRHLVKRGKVA